jgi:hypothetical protein
MDYKVFTYLVYMTISIGLTIWVAQTLVRNGRAFLVDAFHENEALADSVNHLLAVGFYLINLGYVSLALVISDPVSSFGGSIEALSRKIGLVLLVLGAMHFGNLYVFNQVRRRTQLGMAPPPVRPNAYLPEANPFAPPSGA